jgi:hypothetical protein
LGKLAKPALEAVLKQTLCGLIEPTGTHPGPCQAISAKIVSLVAELKDHHPAGLQIRISDETDHRRRTDHQAMADFAAEYNGEPSCVALTSRSFELACREQADAGVR